MRKLKVMGMVSAITMAMLMVVSMTGCGNDASSVSRTAKTTTKSVSQDNDTVSKSADDKNEDTDSKEETQTAESNANEEQANNNLSDEEAAAKEAWEELQESEEHADFMESQAAGQLALEVAATEHGDGMWMIYNVEETEYEGQKCWGISLKDNNNTESNGYYYVVGDDFCICQYEINH